MQNSDSFNEGSTYTEKWVDSEATGTTDKFITDYGVEGEGSDEVVSSEMIRANQAVCSEQMEVGHSATVRSEFVEGMSYSAQSGSFPTTVRNAGGNFQSSVEMVSGGMATGQAYNMGMNMDACSNTVYETAGHAAGAMAGAANMVNCETVQTHTTCTYPIKPIGIDKYPINQDPNPNVIIRHPDSKLMYKQDIGVRYLQPPTPPPPAPIIIKEVRPPAPPAAPPLYIRQRPPVPRTPPPLIIRERPPAPPAPLPVKVIQKVLAPAPPPPRRVIVEKLPPIPPKPRPVIIEKWLPYRQVKRRVIYQRAPDLPPPRHEKNTIIKWTAPHVEVVKNVRNLGVVRADPAYYASRYGMNLSESQYVLGAMSHYGINNSGMYNKSDKVYLEDREEVNRLLQTDYHAGHSAYAVTDYSTNIPPYATTGDYCVGSTSTVRRLLNEYGSGGDMVCSYDTVPNFGYGTGMAGAHYEGMECVSGSYAQQSGFISGGQQMYYDSSASGLSTGCEFINTPGHCVETCVKCCGTGVVLSHHGSRENLMMM